MDNTDKRGPVIILTGGPLGGYQATGPFDTIDIAAEYAEKEMLTDEYKSVMLLNTPLC